MNLEFVLVHKNVKKNTTTTTTTTTTKQKIVKDLTPAPDLVNNLNVYVYILTTAIATHMFGLI